MQILVAILVGLTSVQTWAEGDSGLVLGYEYEAPQGTVPPAGCRLRLKSASDSVLVSLPADKNEAVVSLSPGKWRFERLGCGVGKVWNLDGVRDISLIVKEQSFSYAGYWILEMPKMRNVERKGQAPEETSSRVRPASRSVGIKKLMASLGERKMINAFTGLPFAIDGIEGTQPDGFQLTAKGLKQAGDRLAGLGNKLTSCADQEAQIDPLRFGRLEWKIRYTNGTPGAPDIVKSTSTFRDEFLSCVRASISATPIDNSSFELTVKY